MLTSLLVLALAAQPVQVVKVSSGGLRILAFPSPLRVARSSDDAVRLQAAGGQLMVVGMHRGVAEVTCELADETRRYVVRVDWGQSSDLLEEVDRAVAEVAPQSLRLRSGLSGQAIALRGQAASEEDRAAVRRLIPTLSARHQRDVVDELGLEPPPAPAAAGHGVEGLVAGADGVEVGEAPLSLENGREVHLGRTDATGRFRFAAVSPGTFKLIVGPSQTHLAGRVGLEVPLAAPLRVEVAPGEQLQGRVLGEDGQPIAGASVLASCGRVSARGTTDGSGAFSLGGLESGTCSVQASSEGCPPSTAQLRTGTRSATLTLACGWSTAGSLRSPDGTPPTGCTTLLYERASPPKAIVPNLTVAPGRKPSKAELAYLERAFRFSALQALLPLRSMPITNALARQHLGLPASINSEGTFRLERLSKRPHRLVVACDQGHTLLDFTPPTQVGPRALSAGARVTLEAPGPGPWRFSAHRTDGLLLQTEEVADSRHAFPSLPPGRWLFAAWVPSSAAPDAGTPSGRLALAEVEVTARPAQVVLEESPTRP